MLALALRYLATGESQQSVSLSYCIWKATVSKIVSETAPVIYSSLETLFLKVPSSKKELFNISVGFGKGWNFPHFIGSVDGKHTQIEFPKMTGAYNYNYKCFNSIVLLAIFDSNYY